MDAGDLQQGFRLEEWLVEPRAARITSGEIVRVLTAQQMRLLLCLAGTHGETVSREALREAGWPGETATDEKLQPAIRELRDVLGDTIDAPRFIVEVAKRGYALIGHFEPVRAATDSSDAAPPVTGHRPTMKRRLLAFIGEMHRRSVFKVAAGYLVAMWIVLQVAETTFEPLRLPDWWMTALTILSVVGLPIVVVLAWSYEITESGITLDPGSGAAVRLPRARRAVAPAMVAGVALMAAVTGLAWWRTISSTTDEPRSAPAGGPPSLAVLPLVDMSPAGGNEYLGDGLSEELSARLAQIPGLRVASRTSAFEFRDQNVDVRKIGEALGVRHLLEGSVRREGDAVRVTVQLIDAETGFHLWAGTYDREWRKLLVVQRDIAQAVAEALQIVLVPGVGTGTATADVDPRALDPYLAGLALLRQPGDASGLREATRRFSEAIELAPEFAGAHAGLCRARLRQFEHSRDPAVLTAGELSCQRALEIDPSQVDTEKALAQLRISSGDYAEAEDRYRVLLGRYPEDADIHIGLADALAGQGKQELAEPAYRRATEAEPAYWAAQSALGGFLFGHGRTDEAAAAFEKAATLVPASALAWSNLGAVRQLMGDFSGALAAYQTSLLLEPSVSAHSNLATTHYYLGQFDQAVREYGQAIALGGHKQTIWANLGDALWQVQGRRDDAIEAYRKAIELGEAEQARLGDDPMRLGQLGYNWGRVGDLERSRRYLDRALAIGADQVYVHYYRAVAASDRGDVAEALAALARLVELGYPVELLRAGPEFGSLAADERLKALLDRADRA